MDRSRLYRMIPKVDVLLKNETVERLIAAHGYGIVMDMIHEDMASMDPKYKIYLKNYEGDEMQHLYDTCVTILMACNVHLAAGVHRLEKPLVLTPEDSGVTYVADGDVVISGSRPVTGWRVEPDGTWSAPVPWVKPDRADGFRLMRVNGAMRPRARLPKKGHFTVVNDDLPQGASYNAPRPSFYAPDESSQENASTKKPSASRFYLPRSPVR